MTELLRRALLGLVVLALQTPAPAPDYEVPIHGKGSYVSTRDGRVYYEREGSGPAVIVVAGGPGASHTSFHPWFSRLAADHTVVYFDSIGRGRSDPLNQPQRYTVRRDAEDIEALREALGFETVSLIGHSYGGYPALAYALAYPQRTSKLILSDTLHNAAAWQANIDSANWHSSHLFPDVWEKLVTMRQKGVLLQPRDCFGRPIRN